MGISTLVICSKYVRRFYRPQQQAWASGVMTSWCHCVLPEWLLRPKRNGGLTGAFHWLGQWHTKHSSDLLTDHATRPIATRAGPLGEARIKRPAFDPPFSLARWNKV